MCKSLIFRNYIGAGYPLLWVHTFEEFRAMTVFSKEVGSSMELFSWDLVDAMKKISLKNGTLSFARLSDEPMEDPLVALSWAEKQMPEHGILFLKDFHKFVKDVAVCRKLRNLVPMFKALGKTLVIISPIIEIPVELEKELTVIDFDLPDIEDLRITLKKLYEDVKSDMPGVTYPGNDLPILESALGMTAFEAENAFAISLAEKQVFDIRIIQREKAAVVKKTGVLEVIEVKQAMDDVGGLENVKKWLSTKKANFSKEAREFGATAPKGLLLVGIPGCGKSLIAKAVASFFGRPLLKMDMGKVYGSYVGESESNIDKCLSIADAVSPAVLMIDEFEKAFAGSGEGESDGHGTTKRVLGKFLSWSSDRTSDVFIIATANDVKSLPPALLRSGRFDKIFWVDLPKPSQRKDIFSIHIRKKGRDPQKYNLGQLIMFSDGFSGADIEVAVNNAVDYAFMNGRELSDEDLVAGVKSITPTSGDTEQARKWAEGRGITNASAVEEAVEASGKRRIKV